MEPRLYDGKLVWNKQPIVLQSSSAIPITPHHFWHVRPAHFHEPSRVPLAEQFFATLDHLKFMPFNVALDERDSFCEEVIQSDNPHGGSPARYFCPVQIGVRNDHSS